MADERVLIGKQRLRVTWTQSMVVDVPRDQAKRLLKPYDYLDVCEAAERFRRQSHYAPYNLEDSGVSIEPYDSYLWHGVPVIDTETAGEGYLWSARNLVGDARTMLNRGRYREGHCPDLDRVTQALGRLEEELRLMALAVDEAQKGAA